ncbi:MAG: peptide ABC transporter substrate-binding protein [Anaerolineales bacterium]|nr:peptide ABC transporter substrate-binding protein [Anaerolineales bacterium]
MKLKFWTLFMIIGLVLSACGGGATTPTTEPPTSGDPAPATEAASSASGGGTVTLIIPEEPTTLNYFLADAAIVRQAAEATAMTGLATINEKGEYVATLAQELPTLDNGGLSADYLTVTWKLREGLKWSDGEAITSDDVKFTVEVLSNPDAGALVGTSGFDLITSVETPDDLTAVLTYSAPYPGYLDQFAYGLFPRHATGEPADMANWEWNRNPVGAGPFIVSNWASGESITMTRNPNYYEEGKPYLDSLVFAIVPEPAAQTAMMLNGEAQMQLWPGEFKADYDELLKGIATQHLIPGIWNMAIDFNLSAPFDGDPTASAPHPILGDIRVRQAIASAMDYQTLQKDVLKGSAGDSTNPFAYGWYQCDLPRAFGYDVEKANQLLDEAGWVMGDDGIRVAKGAKYAADGTRLSLELQGYTAFDPLQLTEEFIVENLKAVGIEARIQNYDFSIIFGAFEDNSPRAVGDYDMLIFDRGFTTEPQGYNFDAYHSSRIPTAENPTGGNYFRWVNADVDAALELAGSSFDQQTRKDAYCTVGQAVIDDLPQVYLYLFQDNYGVADSLTGYTLSTWGSMSWGAQNWKIK